MISDKASRCPKCGCPVIKDYINYPQPTEEPTHYENENHTNKWLYAVIGVLIVAIAGFGFLWYSQSKGNKEIREFVMQFSKAVESGDSVTIRNLYPDAADADSLYIPNSEFMTQVSHLILFEIGGVIRLPSHRRGGDGGGVNQQA